MKFLKPVCPQCGKPIRGTVDSISGIAEMFPLNADNPSEYEYTGSTDVDWDSQETRDSESGLLVIGECRHTWFSLVEGQDPPKPAGYIIEGKKPVAVLGELAVTVYTIAHGTAKGGTDCKVFGCQSAAWAHMKSIIEEDIDGDITKVGDEVRALIETGEIEAAWVLWESEIKPALDTYYRSTNELKFSGVKLSLRAET